MIRFNAANYGPETETSRRGLRAYWDYMDAVIEGGKSLGADGSPVPSNEELHEALADLLRRSELGENLVHLFHKAYTLGQVSLKVGGTC
jgi:hypothetical protein